MKTYWVNTIDSIEQGKVIEGVKNDLEMNLILTNDIIADIFVRHEFITNENFTTLLSYILLLIESREK